MVQQPAIGSTDDGKFLPSDQEAREVIEKELGQTLFVEASAGTGKTHSLVTRAVNLVAEGRATLDRIAAITFTEAAAAELRHRIRERLERAAEELEDLDSRERCRQGITDLDQATIRTLHSFAAMILHERPLEAGLPPGFETTDEIAAGLMFNEAWDSWLDASLETEAPLAPNLTQALTLGLSLGQLKEVATAFHENYTDLKETTFLPWPPDIDTGTGALVGQWPEALRLQEFSRLGPGDQLFDHIDSRRGTLGRLTHAEPGSLASLRLLRRSLPLKCTRGRQSDWDVDPETSVNACKALKDLLSELEALALEELEAARRHALSHILESLREFALEYADQRKSEGRAEFHDLLVWTRDMLRDRLDVRDYFRRRFSHLLVDESQDTDPIQAEIAMFLAEDVPDGPPSSGRPVAWSDIGPEKGKLFVVGDPKQSIYRFRRADVGQMRLLQQRMEQNGGRNVSLVQNFRSQPPIADWVNHVFQRWMGNGEANDEAGYVQARYEAMVPRWQAATEDILGPKVWALHDEAVEGRMEAIRRQEAGDIAALLQQIVADEWKVLDPEATESGGFETYRPATYSDICILMPARTALPFLERALEDRNVPYRLESASLIFGTQEVRDLINCLKAIDDPADEVATVAALRSPAFGCSDVELYRHHGAGGRFNCLWESPETGYTPVAKALEVLRRFHADRLWEPPAHLIDRFIRERGLMQASTGHPRMREQWRRYRFMVERAWQFALAGGSSLRAFLRWVQDQMAEGARVTESPVPESDEQSVRVMTVHAAKGLEFPVVVLTGINSQRNRRGQPAMFDRQSGRVEVGVGAEVNRFSTPGYDDLKALEDELSDAEEVRLMYVATTRARDHLVLSLRRSATTRGGNTPAAAISAHLAEAPHLWEPVILSSPPIEAEAEEDEDQDQQTEAITIEHSVEARDNWLQQREELLKSTARPSFASATALNQLSTDDKPEQETTEPWRRGRAGTSVGRAVHAVLQSVDLATGDGLEDRSRAQAVAEGIPGREGDVMALARVALESQIVRRAVESGRIWREVSVASPVGNGSLHGFIDLLFEEADGLVVVDYKTDTVSAEDVRNAVARYRLQGGAYAYAVSEATGKPVKEVVFLYLQPRQEVALPDLEEAMRDAVDAAEELLPAASAESSS